jgi:hypothetical protein
MTTTNRYVGRRGLSGLPLLGDGRIGPLASRLGLTAEHAAAARRQAEREESRGRWAHAIDTWLLAITIESVDASAWRGLARCLRLNGRGKDARTIETTADLVEASWKR